LETDEFVQATIRREFSQCTVITIAHRINTILDSDQVAVLAAGKLVELGPPQVLLAKQNSAFALLARDAGISLKK